MQAVFSHCSRFTGRLPQAAIALAATLLAGAAQAQSFDFDSVTRIARERAEKPYRASSDKLPADLAKLNYDQVRDIRWRPDRALWRAEKLPFEAMFFHLGLYQKEPVLINEVTPQGARHIGYSRADFDYGKNQVRPEAWGDLGFAGFRLHNHLNSSAYKDELVVFQGASYFRALGKGQQYGLSARGLGIAPLTSMFFFDENQPRKEDFRPEVHDSDGLMIATGEGEWLWRPLQNPKQTLVTSFATKNPKGFGLMQRDRQWSNYEDVEARYERRPSAWVRPLHDWGAGRVELVQLNTPDETHDNIVAYWVPAQMPSPGQPPEFAYELSWQGDEQQRPPGAWAMQSRRGVGYTKETAAALRQQAQYVVDFDGPALKALPADATVKAVVTSDANGKVLENIVYRNPATEQWRMTVRVQRQKADRPIELRAFLQHDNNAVSETWTHIILPE